MHRGDGAADESRGPRALTPEERERRQKRAISRVEPELVAEIRAAATDPRAAARTVERVGRTQEALDRDRLDEARRTINPIAKNLPGVAGVQELAGLVAYRLGRWRDAVRSIEAAQALRTNVDSLPCSPTRTVRCAAGTPSSASARDQGALAEPRGDGRGRIVAAGALADQGDITGAIAVMAAASAKVRRVEDYHLRQWYVLGDLHDAPATRSRGALVRAHRAVDDDY